MRNIINKNLGFSLLEVVVVMGIVSLGLVSVSSLMIQNINAQNINKNYLIASMLAQEGIELVRNKRDTNWLRNWAWRTGDAPGGNNDIYQNGAGNTYTISSSTINSTVNNITDAGARLYRDVNGFYTHDTTSNSIWRGITPTDFFRLITVDDLGGETDILEVDCVVQWTYKGKVNNYIASTKLYDWFP